MALPLPVTSAPAEPPLTYPGEAAGMVAVVEPPGSHSANYSSGRVTRRRLDYDLSTAFAWWWGVPGLVLLGRGARGMAGTTHGIEDARPRVAIWRA